MLLLTEQVLELTEITRQVEENILLDIVRLYEYMMQKVNAVEQLATFVCMDNMVGKSASSDHFANHWLVMTEQALEL